MPELRIQIEDDDTDVTSKPNGAAEDSIEDIKRRGDEHTAEAARLRREAAHHRATIARTRVGTALMKADGEAQAAAGEFRNAIEAGDIDTQVAAQARMAEIEARRVRLQEQAEALEGSPLVQHDDPVEALCATRTEPTARWLREHRDWVVDPKKNAKLSAAHFDAVAEGLAEDTAEYFEHIERRIGLRDASKGARPDGERSGDRPPAKYDPSNPNTHVMRGGAEVFLTKGERDRATDGTLTWNYGPNKGKPIGVQEFARRKAEMVRGGWFNRLDG